MQVKKYNEKGQELAIRFGLGAIKAVGINMMEEMMQNRKAKGLFKDIYDFAERAGPKIINKKSVEALAKAGAFDKIHPNRKQIFESCEILNKYATSKEEEQNSNQMSLFSGFGGAIASEKPTLKQVEDWDKEERMRKEFEAFGFFLEHHPLDDRLEALKKRGVIFSNELEEEQIKDSSVIKIAGVVAYNKHRSGAKGRFAYLALSDPFGITETSIFDEELITNARDLMEAGQLLVLETLIRKDEGGTRLLVKSIKELDEFIRITSAREKEYKDIRQEERRERRDQNWQARRKPENKETAPNPPLVAKPTHQAISHSSLNAIPEPKTTTLKQVLIEINSYEAIKELKNLLTPQASSGLAQGSTQKSQIFLLVQKERGKMVKIALPGTYLIRDEEISAIKGFKGIK